MELTKQVSQFTQDFFKQFATPKEQVATVDSKASLFDAAKLMRKNHVGNIIVVELKNGKKSPVGILTDRDLVIETLAQDVDAKTLSVRDIMATELATATQTDDVFSLIAKMKENGVNRLPVVDADGTLAGIVTSKKLVQCLVQGIQDLSALSAQQHEKEKELRH